MQYSNELTHHGILDQKWGVTRDNYISHSKYISKKFVNGRWMYYYDRPANKKPRDYKYVYKEMVNGKWRYYYNSEKQVPLTDATINPYTIKQKQTGINKSILDLKKSIDETFNKKLANIHNYTNSISEKTNEILEKTNSISEKTNSIYEKMKNLSIKSDKVNKILNNVNKKFNIFNTIDMVASKNAKQHNNISESNLQNKNNNTSKPNLQFKSKDDYINNSKKDHKYVRKELKNGKWRYYYDDGSTVEMTDISEIPKFETKQEVIDYLAKQHDIEKFPELNLLDSTKEHSMAESEIVNPVYHDENADSKSSLASKINCTSCALATEMRARGFDVKSKLNLSGKDGLTTDEFREVLNLSSYEFINAESSELSKYTKEEGKQKWDDYHKNVVSYRHFTNSYAKKMKNDFEIDVYSSNVGNGKYKLPNESKDFANEVEKEIRRKFGNRSRGILAINWKNGGSHAVNFEVKNGKITIVDNQTGKTGTVYDYTSRAYNIEFMRTDNADISQQVSLYVENRGEN